ncbi:MAG: dTMP kinase, partial [Bacteroidota bacterium]
MTRGKFIVFEGIDGSGKSTQAALLKAKLKTTQSQPVYLTREPTDSPIGSVIRNILNKRIVTSEKTIAALFLADRLDHIENPVNGMLPKIELGEHVISDRYYLSSYAYHSSHVPLEWVVAANGQCAELLRPDVTFFIDVHPEYCLKRLQKGRDFLDLYENLERLQKVYDNYQLAMAHIEATEHIVRIDGNQEVSA